MSVRVLSVARIGSKPHGISAADNAVEAGIYACDQLMYAGKLKVFTSLSNYYSELRAYRRDKDGKVVKQAII